LGALPHNPEGYTQNIVVARGYVGSGARADLFVTGERLDESALGDRFQNH
jgi:hypothetical protein